MPKPFLSYDDQLDKLEFEKGLIIADRDYAQTMLRQIGYFGLISGYKNPFKNPTTKKYKNGTSFEDIVTLYKFDENLRELFLKYILQIERNIRSMLSYYFTEKFGAILQDIKSKNIFAVTVAVGIGDIFVTYLYKSEI